MSAITENLPDLGKVGADIQSLVDQLNEAAEKLLEKCALMSRGVEKSSADLEAALRRGIEVRKLAAELKCSREYGLDVLERYASILKQFADWKRGVDFLAPLIKRAEQFVAWIDELLALVNRPAPPIDEETLRQRAAQLDEQKAWLKLDDVLAELKGQG